VEIGGTWVTPAWQRSTINTEAKYLQLRHAFETLGCIRVEFETDALNTKARQALARIGATEEGIFRNHMIMPGDSHAPPCGRCPGSYALGAEPAERRGFRRGAAAYTAGVVSPLWPAVRPGAVAQGHQQT
jgi:hypothetical protein